MKQNGETPQLEGLGLDTVRDAGAVPESWDMVRHTRAVLGVRLLELERVNVAFGLCWRVLVCGCGTFILN